MSNHPVNNVPFLDLNALHDPLRAELDDVWRRVTAGNGYIGGDPVAEFEQAWADYCGVEHAVGVANGTDSIELILRALGVGTGDEVIVPTNTFIATAEAVAATGARPVLVDVDPDTMLIGPEQIEPAIGDSTAAVIPVHLYGQPCDMTGINRLAERADIAVVEDAAQAHGASWDGSPIGTGSTAASFSFYPGKNLGAFGDGGAVITNDAAVAARVRSLSNHGRRDGAHVTHDLMGRNSRLDAIQAGVLSVKLPHLDGWNRGRRVARDRYLQRLTGTAAVPVIERPEATSVWHLNVVQVSDRDLVMKSMIDRGVDVRIHYPQPIHRHPALAPQPVLPVADGIADRLLSLPLTPGMTDEQIDIVVDTLLDVLAGLGH